MFVITVIIFSSFSSSLYIFLFIFFFYYCFHFFRTLHYFYILFSSSFSCFSTSFSFLPGPFLLFSLLILLLLLPSYTNLLKTCVHKAMSQNDMRDTTTQQQFVHVHDYTSYTLPLESTTNALFYFLPTLC